MQRLKTVLGPLWIDAHNNQTQADVDQHRARVQALIDQVVNARLRPAPPQLHNAGEAVRKEVTSTDIDNLRRGRSIALATRALLKKGAGNQRLAIAATNGDSAATAYGIRSIRKSAVPGDTRHYLAALTVLGGAGQCEEHMWVAIALARQRHISAVCISAKEVDHCAALLMPERGQKAIVVDGWTTIPSSCLKADSVFADVYTSPEASTRPAPRMFNLVTLDAMRERLSHQLGPEPIKQAMQHDFIRQRNATYQDQPRPRWVSTLPEAIYHEAANHVSDISSHPVSIRKIGPDGREQPYADISPESFAELHAKALTDSRPLLNWLRYRACKQAARPPQHSVTLRHTHTDLLTARNGEQARVSVALTVTQKPYVHDVRLPSKNILYRASDDNIFSTIDTEQSVIETGLLGLARAQQIGFPERFIAPVAPPPNTTIALADYALRRLQQYQHHAPLSHQCVTTHADLQLLDEALAHLPQTAFDNVMKRFATLLPELHPAQIAEGARLWKNHWSRITDAAPLTTAAGALLKGWARHFDDPVIEPLLRDALRLNNRPSRLIATVIRHVLILPTMQHHAIATIDAALAQIPPGAERDALLEILGAEVDQITAASTRAAGLAMVARHR